MTCGLVLSHVAGFWDDLTPAGGVQRLRDDEGGIESAADGANAKRKECGKLIEISKDSIRRTKKGYLNVQ